MIESIILSIGLNDGSQAEIELSPMQAHIVLKILGIQPAGDACINCYSDQTLQKFLELKTNPLRLIEKDHE